MDEDRNDPSAVGRRDFLKVAGAGLTAAGVLLTPRERAAAQSLEEKARLERIAGCTWPIRQLFKTRPPAGGGGGRGGAPTAAGGSAPQSVPSVPPNRDRTTTAEMKQKYGEITMLGFPQWTKDNFPGVTRMDLFSGLFGDVTDDAMFMAATTGGEAGFNPMSPSGRKWLDQLANILVKTGTKVQHISNNAPVGLADFGSPEADARRKGGVATGKRWLEGCAVLGVKSMRMNSPRALGPQIRPNANTNGGDGYPRNPDIVPLMNAAIESYKE